MTGLRRARGPDGSRELPQPQLQLGGLAHLVLVPRADSIWRPPLFLSIHVIQQPDCALLAVHRRDDLVRTYGNSRIGAVERSDHSDDGRCPGLLAGRSCDTDTPDFQSARIRPDEVEYKKPPSLDHSGFPMSSYPAAIGRQDALAFPSLGFPTTMLFVPRFGSLWTNARRRPSGEYAPSEDSAGRSTRVSRLAPPTVRQDSRSKDSTACAEHRPAATLRELSNRLHPSPRARVCRAGPLTYSGTARPRALCRSARGRSPDCHRRCPYWRVPPPARRAAHHDATTRMPSGRSGPSESLWVAE